MSKYGISSGPYFPAFGLNTERYGVFLRIQSTCGKIRTRKTLNTDTFHAAFISFKEVLLLIPDWLPILYEQTIGNGNNGTVKIKKYVSGGMV